MAPIIAWIAFALVVDPISGPVIVNSDEVFDSQEKCEALNKQALDAFLTKTDAIAVGVTCAKVEVSLTPKGEEAMAGKAPAKKPAAPERDHGKGLDGKDYI